MSRLCRDTSSRSLSIGISRRSDTRLVRLLDGTFLFASSLSFAVVFMPCTYICTLVVPMLSSTFIHAVPRS